MIASTDDFVTGFTGIVYLFVVLLALVIAVVWIAFPFIMRAKMNELMDIQREQGRVLLSIEQNIRRTCDLVAPKLEAPPINEFNRLSLHACKCNVCSKEIEFKLEQVGQTVACPHCGMETVLYLPKVNA